MIALAPSSEPCRACRERPCCVDRDALLTGADVARIATALEVAPMTFATTVPAPHGDGAADTFVEADPGARGSARRVRLALRRRAEPDGRTACVFLLGLGSGRRACGLGALAPLGCRAYPATADAPGACWRTFTAAEVAPVRAGLWAQAAAERAAWHAELAAWNAAVLARPVPLPLEVFLDAVLARAAEP